MDEFEFKKLFGVRLRALRKGRNLTQEKLSELIGLDPQYYCKMENGNHFPSVKTLAKIIEILDIDSNDLFNFSASKNPNIDNITASLVSLNSKELKVVKEFINSVVKLR